MTLRYSTNFKINNIHCGIHSYDGKEIVQNFKTLTSYFSLNNKIIQFIIYQR
jgi:hypothetical protein